MLISFLNDVDIGCCFEFKNGFRNYETASRKKTVKVLLFCLYISILTLEIIKKNKKETFNIKLRGFSILIK